ncbi:hypothetical protein JCM10207_002425 [Rhodosporidiobolus poonsookiae]
MAHELSVEGEKVIERDEHGNVISSKNYSRVHAGYAAAAHNKTLVAETRENAEHIMHDLEAAHGDAPATESDSKASGSPKTSHAKPAVEHAGGEGSRHHSHDPKNLGAGTTDEERMHADEVHQHRVIGGYKATLHRDTTSEEAKQHARDKLDEMGVDYNE